MVGYFLLFMITVLIFDIIAATYYIHNTTTQFWNLYNGIRNLPYAFLTTKFFYIEVMVVAGNVILDLIIIAIAGASGSAPTRGGL